MKPDTCTERCKSDTTNKSVRDWTDLLAGDEVLATAILDRLLHKAHVPNTVGTQSCC